MGPIMMAADAFPLTDASPEEARAGMAQPRPPRTSARIHDKAARADAAQASAAAPALAEGAFRLFRDAWALRPLSD
jgi:hypothetical protein